MVELAGTHPVHHLGASADFGFIWFGYLSIGKALHIEEEGRKRDVCDDILKESMISRDDWPLRGMGC